MNFYLCKWSMSIFYRHGLDTSLSDHLWCHKRVLAFSMVDNSLPPLEAGGPKGKKLSGFAVQPVISTRSGFFLSGIHAGLNLFSTLIQESGKD